MKNLLATIIISSATFLPNLSFAIDCSGYSLWSSGDTYTGGDLVQLNNKAYQAKWWSLGNTPETHSSASDEWKALGNCDTGGGNIAPTANANGPYSATKTNSAISFSSAGSNDIDGSISSYSWNFGDGASSTLTNPTHTYTHVGTYTVTLTVTDNNAASNTASSVVTFSDSTAPPPPSGTCVGLPSYIAGTSYATGIHIVNRVNSTNEIIEFECVIGGWCSSPAAWAYEPGNGEHWQDAWRQITICTNNPGNQKPIANVNGPYKGLKNQIISFSSNGSSDSDGTITAYTWSFGDGATSNEANPSHIYGNAGSYTVTLTVTDNGSASTTSSTIANITTVTGNQPPTANANGPYNDKANTAILFSSAGSIDSDGSIVSFQWNFGDGNSSMLANPTHTYLNSGIYTVTLTVTDGDAATASTSTKADITSVTNPTNQLPHRVLVGYWHNFINAAGYVAMANVDPVWDIINVSFAENARGGAEGEVAFFPAEESDAGFRTAVKNHQRNGKKVLLSLGGANAHIQLNSIAARDNFVRTMGNLIADYGFDGMDIDLEGGSLNMNAGDTIANPKTPTLVNLIAATRTLKARFGSGFVLTMAPETAYVQGGYSNFGGIWGAYLPLIHGLRNDLTLLHVQHYNTGSINGADGKIYTPGTADFHVALSDMMITGFPAGRNPNNFFPGLRADQVAIGLPSSLGAAGSGYTSPAIVHAALDCLIKRQHCGSYTPAQAHKDFRGLMTWSINWDLFTNKAFSTPHRAYFNQNP